MTGLPPGTDLELLILTGLGEAWRERRCPHVRQRRRVFVHLGGREPQALCAACHERRRISGECLGCGEPGELRVWELKMAVTVRISAMVCDECMVRLTYVEGG